MAGRYCNLSTQCNNKATKVLKLVGDLQDRDKAACDSCYEDMQTLKGTEFETEYKLVRQL